ncbi:MAG TPA: hypothetical protein VIK78_09380 [Ruminiclostridium sp.]
MKIDFQKALHEFISIVTSKQEINVVSIYLTVSFARCDAVDSWDLMDTTPMQPEISDTGITNKSSQVKIGKERNENMHNENVNQTTETVERESQKLY